MTNLEPIITTGLIAYASKEMIAKILGPTAEYLGQETKNLIDKCNVNISKILLNAYQKLKGSKYRDDQGINLRVFKNIIDEGRYIEDDIFVEYFGGILANSRINGENDDRGVYYLSVIKSLSSYQIKVHYIAYCKLLKDIQTHNIEFGRYKVRQGIRIFIPQTYLINLFNIKGDAPQHIFVHCISGLREKNLIAANSVYSDVFPNHPNINESGILMKPTIQGMELFLWACGIREIDFYELTSINFTKIPDHFNVDELDIIC